MELTQTQENYFSFLKELYSTLELTDKVNMKKLMSKHNVSQTTSMILQNKKIISKPNKNSRDCLYNWVTTVKPNVRMAIAVNLAVNEYQLQSFKRRTTITTGDVDKKESSANLIESRKVTIKPRNKKQVTTNKMTFSVLWGLFKFSIDK